MPEKRPDRRIDLDRRGALRAAAVAGVAVPLVAACGSGDEAGDGAATGTTSTTDDPTSAATPTQDAAADVLTTTAEVPDGGGLIFADAKVVVTQPETGTFKGFSAECTHQGCLVAKVADDEIVCTCHNSRFSIADGSVQGGPANSPLPAVELSVEGDSISLA